MTETEITKELQSAVEWFAEHGKNTNTAIVGICERAICLINSKEAEIDRLTAVEESHREQNGELRTAVERLNFENMQMIASIKGLEERARAEAVKKVLYRVKTSSNVMELVFSGALVRKEYTITEESLDQIAKEMGCVE